MVSLAQMNVACSGCCVCFCSTVLVDATIFCFSFPKGLAFLETVEHLNDFRTVHAIVDGFPGFSRLKDSSGLHQSELLRSHGLRCPQGLLNFPYSHLAGLKKFCD